MGLQPRRVNSHTRKGFWLPHASRGAVPPKKLQAALGLLTRLPAHCREASQFACPQIFSTRQDSKGEHQHEYSKHYFTTDRQNGDAFALWYKRSDYIAERTGTGRSRANRREELSSEVAFRQQHGFETCISIRGLHPDKLLESFKPATPWVAAFSSAAIPTPEREA